MLRAATYVRMSSDRQEDSPARQRSLLVPYLRAKGYVLAKEYEDLEQRGWDEDRLGLAKLIADARDRCWDVLVVDEWSRLSRSNFITTIATIIGPLRDAGVRLDTVRDGPKDWNDIAGQIMMVVDSFKSESESRDIGRRTLSKMMMLAEQGELFLGPTPYGYKAIEQDGRRVRLEPGDPAEIEIVRWLFDSCANRGRGVTALARDLTERKVPPPGGTVGWHPSTIRSILTNPNYAGHYRFNMTTRKRFAFAAGGTIQVSTPNSKNKSKRFRQAEADVVVKRDTHPPLVDQGLFDAAAAALAARRSAPVGAERKARLLSGVLHCYHCGRVMYSVKQLGVPKWRCATNYRRLPGWEPCEASFQVSEALVEDAVVEAVVGIYTNPAHRAERERLARAADKKARDTSLVDSLRKKIAAVEKRIANGYENLIDLGKAQAAVLAKKLTELEAYRDRWKKDLKAASRPRPSPAGMAARVVTLKDAFGMTAPARANAIVKSFFVKVVVEFRTRPSRSGKKRWHEAVGYHPTRRPAPGPCIGTKLLVELERELGVRFSG
jgi:site-specific DNA recombinase